MLIAHLPAGYLLTKILSPTFRPDQRLGLWFCGLVGSVLPDIDFLLFYLEGGVRNHRLYPTHWPLFWLGLWVAVSLILLTLKKKRAIVYPSLLLAGVFSHLLLDIIAGPVFYAAPLSWDRLQLVKVPALYSWWLLNYLRHWTFQLEMLLTGLAGLVFCLSWGGQWGPKGPWWRPANRLEPKAASSPGLQH